MTESFDAAKAIIWGAFLIGAVVSILGALTIFLQLCDFFIVRILKRIKADAAVVSYFWHRKEFYKYMKGKDETK